MRKTRKVLQGIKNISQNSFAQKIKSVDEVKKIIGRRPRKKKVVMCHGTFDIIHPGHLRQLIYAKSKGDILIVSLNADKYLPTGPFTPYVQQEQRAIHIAGFEIVDFVVISQTPTGAENIKKLEPDFFVRGFEQSLQSTNPAVEEETKALASYGGEIVYSPGDLVYSPNLLNIKRADLSIEQLATLMDAEKINFELLRSTINKFKKLKIHVIGDVIVDKYSKCTILGQAQKAVAFSVRLDGTEIFIGGAGIVAKHLKSLGANVILTTVVGEDETANQVVNNLKEFGIEVNALKDPVKPTTTKERFLIDSNKILLQVDKLDNNRIPNHILEKICSIVEHTPCDAVICSDFRHGIFNHETILNITWAIPSGVLRIADSQVSNRWGNILDFSGFDLITPNEREARFALGDQDTTIRPLAQTLYNRARCRFLILKLGENGLLTYRSPGIESREFFYIDSLANHVVDSIGAGDSLLAAASSTLAASKNIVQASILGNICAAIECAKLGNVPITVQELTEKINELEKETKNYGSRQK